MISQFGAEAICSLAGVPQPNTAVTVRNASDNTLARLFTDGTGQTIEANPVITDSNGDLIIFLAPGRYTYAIASGTAVPFNVPPDVTALGAANGVATLDSAGHIPTAQLAMGVANGIATLDAGGHVPAGQLQSVVFLDGSSHIPVAQIPALPESQITNLNNDLNSKAADNAVVHLSSTESITGAKTFTVALTIVGAQFVSGIKLTSGSGAPTASGAAGDLYLRVDTPYGIYRCVTGTTWISTTAPGVWQAVSLLNSWVAIGSESVPGYRLLPDSRVELRGAFSTGTSGTTAFALASGFRPLTTFRYPIVSSGGFGYVQISTAGNVSLNNSSIAGAVSTAAYLDGITFATS